jgi:NADH-quinone oxidoreductase subunit L
MHAIPALIAILSPLVASGLIAALGPQLGERAARIGISALAISAVSAVLALYQSIQYEPVLLKLPGMTDPFVLTLLVDRLTAVMMVLITGVSLVIHVFSYRYMHDDQGYIRFFSLVSLLTSILLSLVTSGNLLWLFISWHAITWLLPALLSFDRGRPAARQAGRTTFRVHAIGDGGLLLAIVLVYVAYGTLDLGTLFQMIKEAPVAPVFFSGTWWEVTAPSAITVVLVLTIMTKSAQFPFHVWLPGTIEAPTPVSALLHAGIVNAGGFLVNRLAPLFGSAPTSLYLMFLIGGLTALIGASTMLTQSSIKRTLVYSTMGQMGYMVMECGLGAFALAVFHLCAHGLFKATLFLNSGTHIQKARSEFKLPGHEHVEPSTGFSLMTWATGLGVTLILPLIILLAAHGLVHIPLLEAQGTLIFLFFAWVTSAQAIFSLYRLNAVASWKVSLTMVATLALISLTYLWAGEAFTGFLYPEPGEAAAYFQAASWHTGLFDAFVALAAILVIGVWIVLYGEAHGVRMLIPAWLGTIRTRAYVAFLNGLYVEDLLRAWGGRPRGPKVRPQ